jgi:hypothetical protein
MATYKRKIIINNPNCVILSNLPFQPGQQVEITLTTTDTQSLSSVEKLRTLLRETQSLPQAQTITEEEIAAEIAAYRSGA